jgi:hypothetical protein
MVYGHFKKIHKDKTTKKAVNMKLKGKCPAR